MSMANVNPIVQYVVVRGDLISKLKWTTGAVIAQACHACNVVAHLYYKDNLTQEYFRDVDKMHTIVLEAADEESLNKLSEVLTTENVGHKLWIEQPENFPACLAVKPFRKNDVQKYFKHFKLLK